MLISKGAWSYIGKAWLKLSAVVHNPGCVAQTRMMRLNIRGVVLNQEGVAQMWGCGPKAGGCGAAYLNPAGPFRSCM